MTGQTSGPIVLVGLMAAGKTTVGRILAKGCGLHFVDLDHEIERQSSMSATELFDSRGEPAFREIEAAVSVDLAPRSDMIVAVGGGWMANSVARKAWPDARIVWLSVSPAVAALRIGSRTATRPLLKGANPESVLERLLTQRLPAYAEATYTVDTDSSGAVEIAAEIASLLGLRFTS